MVWNPIWPLGTVSVAANRSTGQDNTSYVKTTMNKDHYWDSGVNEDGHHKFVQTVATNDSTPSVAVNTALATGMDLVYYSRFKTSTESTAQQDCQPFVKNTGGDVDPWPNGVMQLLGMRAVVVFDFVTGNVPQDIVYSHNVTSITKDLVGGFTVTFTNNLPSINYLVLGGGMGNSNGSLVTGSVYGAATINTSKKVATCKLAMSAPTRQGWYVFFGG